ncbi:methyltransferase [[Pseudomonas] boreopolis]|uniref:Methyltransferase n=1 Tax=Xanthomonas boreopolis TaxID=86183 RepID=A0A919KIV7_9XANT|nr:methyltransferase [[Pseudomonas] boreopolis]
MSDTVRPLSPPQAQAIARAFLPAHPLGNRYDYYYTRIKLRTDPLYPGVLEALRGTRAPLLDLGCGLGLLAHALRADGQALDYRGVDIDAAKIRRARRIAERSGLPRARFEVLDLKHGAPGHRGSVALLDVLQYLPEAGQSGLIADTARMLEPGARLVIRCGLDDGSRRGRTSRIGDVLAHVAGWMQERPRCPPTRARLQAELDAAGLRARFTPLYGNTPFNNWLIVAEPA